MVSSRIAYSSSHGSKSVLGAAGSHSVGISIITPWKKHYLWADIPLILADISTYLSVEGDYLLWGILVAEWQLLSHIAQDL